MHAVFFFPLTNVAMQYAQCVMHAHDCLLNQWMSGVGVRAHCKNNQFQNQLQPK